MGFLPRIGEGGVVVRDGDGNPTNPPGMSEFYAPPNTFDVNCELTMFGNDCGVARWTPRAHNAIISELLCLAVAMNPNGSFDCESLCNIANAFDSWKNGTYVGSLRNLAAAAFKDCTGATHVQNAIIPTCAQMTAAIGAAIAAIPGDKFLQGLQSYNSSTNVMTLLMSDGSTVAVDMTSLISDAIADRIPLSQKGVANGVATLDAGALIPVAQIPTLSYIPTAEKAVANGVASLDATGKVPVGQIPTVPVTLPARIETVAMAVTNWNTIAENGWYKTTTAATDVGAPDLDNYMGECWVWDGGTLRYQEVYRVNSSVASASATFCRWYRAGAWTAWAQLLKTQTEQDARFIKLDLSNWPTALSQLWPDSARLITDWNNANENGWWMGVDAANNPAAGWFIGNVERHNAIYMTQTVHAFAAASASDTQRFRRHCQNNVWTAWYRLRDSETELDARYALVSATSEWVEILDTTIGAAVANVEVTWTAGTYCEVLVVLSDLSCSAAGASLTVDLRHSGGSILSCSPYRNGATGVADVDTTEAKFVIGLDAATKRHLVTYPGVTLGLDAAILHNVSTNATAPDRVRISYSSGNIDDGRVIIKALKA